MLPPEGAVREDAADGLLAPPATIPPRPRLAPNVQLVPETEVSSFGRELATHRPAPALILLAGAAVLLGAASLRRPKRLTG